MIKVFKLDKEAVVPTRAHSTDAGIDLYSLEDVFIPVGETRKIKTGIAINIEPGFVGKLAGRSSMNSKGIITAEGVIDAGYSADVSVILHNFSNTSSRDSVLFQNGYHVKKGDKICQMLIYRVETSPVVEVKELWNSERGAKSFGSSGR